MKKIALVAALFCLGSGVFAQGLSSSMRGGVLLDNNKQAAFSQEQSYFYVIQNTELQLLNTDGVFKVSDFFEYNSPTGGEPGNEFSGKVEFTFAPVKTDKGLTLKINSDIANWDGVSLKDATISVAENATGLTVNFSMKKGDIVQGKVFEVLVAK